MGISVIINCYYKTRIVSFLSENDPHAEQKDIAGAAYNTK